MEGIFIKKVNVFKIIMYKETMESPVNNNHEITSKSQNKTRHFKGPPQTRHLVVDN